jgi:hypothetical protein
LLAFFISLNYLGLQTQMAWEKGQSGNPSGPGKGIRRKFAESFLQAVQDDWKEHGAAAIAKVREDDPSTYLRVCAAILPKEIEVEVGEGLAALLSGISDRESAGAVGPLEEPGTDAVCH